MAGFLPVGGSEPRRRIKYIVAVLCGNLHNNKTRMRVTAASPSAEFKKVPKLDFGYFGLSEQHADGTSLLAMYVKMVTVAHTRLPSIGFRS